MDLTKNFDSPFPADVTKLIGGYKRRFPTPPGLPHADALCPRCFQRFPVQLGATMKPVEGAFRPLVQCEGCGKKWVPMSVECDRPTKPDWMKE